uniref:Profilin n=1 Tax=Leptobrachium leishanense TaxID=445787 RepID=A0A8C5LX85_9ANUR
RKCWNMYLSLQNCQDTFIIGYTDAHGIWTAHAGGCLSKLTLAEIKNIIKNPNGPWYDVVFAKSLKALIILIAIEGVHCRASTSTAYDIAKYLICVLFWFFFTPFVCGVVFFRRLLCAVIGGCLCFSSVFLRVSACIRRVLQ